MKTVKLVTPIEAAKEIRRIYEHWIIKSGHQYILRVNEQNSLPPEERRTGGKWLTTYQAFLLIKLKCNGMDARSMELWDQPCDNVSIQKAVKETMPELFEDYWGKPPKVYNEDGKEEVKSVESAKQEYSEVIKEIVSRK